MKIPVGLDVSVASTSVCALGAVGKIMNKANGAFGSGIACRAHSRFAWQRDSCGPGGRPTVAVASQRTKEAGFETVLTETKRVKSALKSTSTGPDYCRSACWYGRNSMSQALPPPAQQQRELCRPRRRGSLRTCGLWPSTRHQLRDSAARNAISRSCLIPAMLLC